MAGLENDFDDRGRGGAKPASKCGPATNQEPRTANPAPGLPLRPERDDLDRLLWLNYATGLSWDYEPLHPGWLWARLDLQNRESIILAVHRNGVDRRLTEDRSMATARLKRVIELLAQLPEAVIAGILRRYETDEIPSGRQHSELGHTVCGDFTVTAGESLPSPKAPGGRDSKYNRSGLSEPATVLST